MSSHTFTLTVEIDPSWVEYLTRYNDIFGPAYAGYWLRGVECDARGWLCWEKDDQHRSGEEPNCEQALQAWSNGEPLPAGWYRLDKATVLRAWEEGVKQWGVDWYENADSTRYDFVVQKALLGELRYG